MGIFSFFRKSTSEQICQSIADSIVESAFEAGLHFKTYGNDKAVDVAAEFVFVLLHFVDASAFAELGDEKRNSVFDRIALLTIIAFTDKFFNKNAPADSIAAYRVAMLDVLNSRSNSYGLCKTAFTEKVVGFSFFVNKALNLTDRESIDSIIGDRSNYTEADYKDLPNVAQIDALGRTLTEQLSVLDVVNKLQKIK